MATRELNDCDNAAALLALVRDRRTAVMRAEADQIGAAVAWAAMHSTESLENALTVPGCEGEVAVAGPGAPLVTEFCVMELAAAMGMSSDAGSIYLGDAVELAHRLPRIYAQVRALRLPVWKARRIAQATKDLPPDGAAHVDTHLAPVARKVSFAQLDRTVEEARVRYDTAEAEARARAAWDKRHLDIDTRQVSFDGCVDVHGVLDLADALDLEDALAHRAAEIAALDPDLPLDVRRSLAMGDLARGQTAIAINTEAGEAGEGPKRKARQVVLYVHLADAAIARLENTRSLISVEQVRSWCTNPDTQVVIKPVIDLTGHVHVDAYEVPDRLKERQVLLQHSCVFPLCRRPARRCDHDHVDPAARGGPTCDHNLAPLCRRHHRLKTHGGWTYTKVDATTFEWRSPHGLTVRRDHTGTDDLTPRP